VVVFMLTTVVVPGGGICEPCRDRAVNPAFGRLYAWNMRVRRLIAVDWSVSGGREDCQPGGGGLGWERWIGMGTVRGGGLGWEPCGGGGLGCEPEVDWAVDWAANATNTIGTIGEYTWVWSNERFFSSAFYSPCLVALFPDRLLVE
jgi:hypothetical protein